MLGVAYSGDGNIHTFFIIVPMQDFTIGAICSYLERVPHSPCEPLTISMRVALSTEKVSLFLKSFNSSPLPYRAQTFCCKSTKTSRLMQNQQLFQHHIYYFTVYKEQGACVCVKTALSTFLSTLITDVPFSSHTIMDSEAFGEQLRSLERKGLCRTQSARASHNIFSLQHWERQWQTSTLLLQFEYLPHRLRPTFH